MNEKLDFGFLPHEDILEATAYSKDNIDIGNVSISYHKNDFIVTAYVASEYFEIKKDCKDLYEALDVANQWWSENKSEWEIF